ncbi:Os03g0280900 [Oryza sativa Japonica Group]|uniref:Os03g0280900 protein n=1 Tax=Oryza sativa subsp. japonica TaxID=39947 RepID=A0A0P0VW70_ORYSJ|nr:Os03g0280900 [Oryza sativa Japonica Group]
MGSTTSWRMSSNRGSARWRATFSLRPVKKLSTTMTLSPRASSSSTRWLPTKPAPPVTTTRRGGLRTPTGRRREAAAAAETTTDDAPPPPPPPRRILAATVSRGEEEEERGVKEG